MPPKAIMTPSPHRFITKKGSAQPGKPHVGTQSGLKRETQRTDDGEKSSVPSGQFAQTPRFAHSRSGLNHELRRSASPPQSGYLHALRGSKQMSEAVDDADPDDEEMLDNGQLPLFPTDEDAALGDKGWDQSWTDELPMSPKRRKLGNFSLPDVPGLPPEPSPISHIAGREPHSTPFHSIVGSSASTNDTMIPRPTFVRPASRDNEPSEPFPEIFSPHRRGAKFVAGGMAAMAQQWVLETGQVAIQSRRGLGYLQGEVYMLRARIDSEVEGDGPFSASMRTSDGQQVKVLFTGGGNASTATRREDLGIGVTIGVRAPLWEVELEGEMWMVAADWRVLA